MGHEMNVKFLRFGLKSTGEDMTWEAQAGHVNIVEFLET
jgi:hypothetical protein